MTRFSRATIVKEQKERMLQLQSFSDSSSILFGAQGALNVLNPESPEEIATEIRSAADFPQVFYYAEDVRVIPMRITRAFFFRMRSP